MNSLVTEQRDANVYFWTCLAADSFEFIYA